MNRRGFLSTVAGVVSAAVAAAKLPLSSVFDKKPDTTLQPGDGLLGLMDEGTQTLTYQGIPIVCNRDMPTDWVIFAETIERDEFLYRYPRALGVITNIGEP